MLSVSQYINPNDTPVIQLVKDFQITRPHILHPSSGAAFFTAENKTQHFANCTYIDV